MFSRYNAGENFHNDTTPTFTLKDEFNYFKNVVIRYSFTNRIRSIAASLIAIEKLQKNPSCENADKLIDKTLSRIIGLELVRPYNGPAISHKSVLTFIDIIKSKGDEKLNNYADQIEEDLKKHHPAFTKKEKREGEIQNEPGAY